MQPAVLRFPVTGNGTLHSRGGFRGKTSRQGGGDRRSWDRGRARLWATDLCILNILFSELPREKGEVYYKNKEKKEVYTIF